jgi:RNA polymerase sigma-70 factor, ECF subfamily
VRDVLSLLPGLGTPPRPAEAAPTASAATTSPDIGALFVADAPFLLRVVERLTGSGDHVEDLVQEVFIVAHRRRHELRDGPDLRGWLYRVASHKAMQHRRSLFRRFRLSRAVSAEPIHHSIAVPDDVAAARQRGLQIRKAVLELPFLQREVFVLSELEELDTRTIATLLAIPEGTVASRLHTARRLFRERWSADGGGA